MTMARPNLPSFDDADTAAKLAVLHERSRTQESALADHDRQFGEVARDVSAIRDDISTIKGAVAAAKWALPLFGAVLVAATATVVAVVVHWR